MQGIFTPAHFLRLPQQIHQSVRSPDPSDRSLCQGEDPLIFIFNAAGELSDQVGAGFTIRSLVFYFDKGNALFGQACLCLLSFFHRHLAAELFGRFSCLEQSILLLLRKLRQRVIRDHNRGGGQGVLIKQHVRGNFVERIGLILRDRLLRTVHNTGLQAGVQLIEVYDRRRCAKTFHHTGHDLVAGYTELLTLQILDPCNLILEEKAAETILQIVLFGGGEALDAAVAAVSKALKGGDKVTLVGFGTFSVAKRAARQGINPATKKAITIPAKSVVKFKAGSELEL